MSSEPIAGDSAATWEVFRYLRPYDLLVARLVSHFASTHLVVSASPLLAFASRSSRTVYNTSRPVFAGLTLSPDGHCAWIASTIDYAKGYHCIEPMGLGSIMM
jgi:hypothetical protein